MGGWRGGERARAIEPPTLPISPLMLRALTPAPRHPSAVSPTARARPHGIRLARNGGESRSSRPQRWRGASFSPCSRCLSTPLSRREDRRVKGCPLHPKPETLNSEP